MCGNVGIINREENILESAALIKFFKQGLIADSVRGLDGTGILAISKNKSVVHKKALASQNFLSHSNILNTISDSRNIVLCGHNRAATTGAITDKGSHPFNKGKITLFHNGTLDTWSTLSKGSYTIDSEAICAGISEKGAVKTLEDISGAFALVWYNEDEDTINFARNSERPLYFCALKGSESIIYASEKGMISWLAEKNHIEIEEIKALDVGKILSVSITSPSKAKITPFKIKAKIIDTYYSGGYNYGKNYNGYTPPAKKRYHHLADCIIRVDLISFSGYGYKSNYGCIGGRYKDCVGNIISVNVPGQLEQDALKAIEVEDLTFLRVTTVGESDVLWCVLLDSKTLEKLNIEEELLGTDNLTLSAFPKTKKKAQVIDLKKRSTASTKFQKKDAEACIGSFGLRISRKVFDTKIKDGCTFCSTSLKHSEQENIIWIDEDSPACLSCTYEVI